MGFIHLQKTKEDFMKNIKLKRFYLLELAIAVTISLSIGCIAGMKVFSYLYLLSGINSKSVMHINQRINSLEQRIKGNCENKERLKPVKL